MLQDQPIFLLAQYSKSLLYRLGFLISCALLTLSGLAAQTTCSSVSGGDVTLIDGSRIIIVCTDDGIDDMVDVNLIDNTGGTSVYLITSPYGFILDTPAGPPFNFEGTGSGGAFIYNFTFGPDFTGNINIGDNVCDLTAADGCFSLSSKVTVSRRTGENCQMPCDVTGGDLSLLDGSNSITICAGDGISDAFDVTLDNNSGPNVSFLITDTDGMILGLPENPPFNLDNAGLGICLVYNISFSDDLTGLTVGANANDLDGCFDLSNPIQVVRNVPNAGSITFDDGSIATAVCLLGDDTAVSVQQNEADQVSGPNLTFVITDGDGIILAVPESNGPFDVGSSGIGNCMIYYLAYADGITGLSPGNSIDDLEGCFDLSNSITTNRFAPDAGSITFEDGSLQTTVCLNPDSNTVVQAIQQNDDLVEGETQYIITDGDGTILGTGNESGSFDVGPAGIGNCVIYFLASNGLITGDTMGGTLDNITGCFDLSNGIETVRIFCEEPCTAAAGTIAFTGGGTETTICLEDDNTSVDVMQVNSDTLSGLNFTFIITDSDGMILGVPEEGPFDLGPAGLGTCIIYYVAFEDDFTGAEQGLNIDGLEGCFDLSNGVAATRVTGEDCPDNGITSFTSFITGSQAIQCPMTTTGSGMLAASLEGNTLTVSGNFSNLSSDFDVNVAGGAHLHTGMAGMTGGIAVILNSELDSDLRGGTFLPDSNTFELTDEQVTILMNRGMYVNIHTLDAPSGEIRGQVLVNADAYNMASLSGIYEVPAVVTPAIGGVAIEVNGNTITVSGSFNGLEGDIATQILGGAHIHQAISGRNGPVLFPLVMTIGEDNRSAIFPADSNTFELSDEQMMVMNMEMLYVNIHSAEVMSGELRGQVASYSTAKFYANPSGHQTRPVATNTTGNGRLLIKLNDNSTITVSGSINDLMDTIRTDILGGGHLHLAVTGANGPVSFPLNMELDDNRQGAIIKPGDNTFDVTVEQMESFYAREYYANFHTAAVPSGEIRGQVMNLAKAYFGSNLSGLNSNPLAVKTTGNGFVMYELCNDQLTVTGSFADLQSDFNSAIAGGSHLHLGDAAGTGPLFASLVPELADDLRSGSYPASENTFVLSTDQLDALYNDSVYLNIHTLDNGAGEIRGQVLRDDNAFPTGPVIVAPENATTVIVFDGGSDLQEGTFNSATDSDDNLLVYVIEATLAADTLFESPIGCLKVGTDTSSFATLNAIFDTLINNNVPVGTVLELRYRIRAIDGSVSTTGPVNTITLVVSEEGVCIADAGSITFMDGSTETMVCLDPDSNTIVQAIQVSEDEVMGDNSQFIITDGNGMILGAGNESGMFDVGPAGIGNCVIYFLTSEGDISGDTMGGMVADITGCFDLSNGITTIRDFCEEGVNPGDIVLNEVDQGGQIEFFNPGTEEVAMEQLFLINSTSSVNISTLNVECGELALKPGDYLVVSGFTALNTLDDEIALANRNIANEAGSLIDYVAFGSTDHSLSNLAAEAGIWTAGTLLESPSSDLSLQVSPTSSEWMNAAPTLCELNADPNAVTDLQSGISLELFPNPTRRDLTILTEGILNDLVNIEVFDQQGRQVLQLLNATANEQVIVPVNNLATGSYYLRIQTGKTVLTDRFVKLR